MLMKPPTLPLHYAHSVPYDDLVTALKLIRHATAPTHEDGAYHEAAFGIADPIVKRIEAREAYDASSTTAGERG